MHVLLSESHNLKWTWSNYKNEQAEQMKEHMNENLNEQINKQMSKRANKCMNVRANKWKMN